MLEVDSLTAHLDRYHLFHAAGPELLSTFGRTAESREADERALALTKNPAEHRLLEQRLGDPVIVWGLRWAVVVPSDPGWATRNPFMLSLLFELGPDRAALTNASHRTSGS